MPLFVSPLAIGVATFFVVALLATLLLRQRSPRFVDAFIVSIAVLTLVVQLSIGTCHPAATERFEPTAPTTTSTSAAGTTSTSAAGTSTAGTTTPAGTTTTTDPAPLPRAEFNWDENVGNLGSGLVMYCSSLKKASWSEGFGRTWRNMASRASPFQATCTADGSVRDPNLIFKSTPAFSRRNGMQLAQNSLSGPYSHQLGVNGDQAMSVIVYAKFLGADTKNGISVFKVFANTPGNVGVSLVLKNCEMAANGTLTGDAIVNIGESSNTSTQKMSIDPTRRYMWVLVKNYTRVVLSMIDVGATSFVKTVLLDKVLPAQKSIVFSNVNMSINEDINWNAEIIAFAMYDRAINDTDMDRIFNHYQAADRAFDAEYQNMQAAINEATEKRKCPYDTATCNTCGGVTDWSVQTNLISASTVCRKQIDTYCTANPSHASCVCWNSANAEYGTTCKAYRALFSGAEICPAPPTPTLPVVPVPPSSNGECSVLSQKNLDAVSKLIDVVQAKRLKPHYEDHDIANNRNPRRPKYGRHRPPPRPPLYEEEKKKKKGFWETLFGSDDDP